MQLALYFGYRHGGGHYLQGLPGGRSTLDPKRDIPGFPWRIDLLDGGLLRNGNIPDDPDGRVWWTCGGIAVLWHAFYWWDRSGDLRPASNSGFYVRGFEFDAFNQAFDYACTAWPEVVARQCSRLVFTRAGYC